jgi:N-acetylneuraminic acid mutarotase
MRGMNRRSPAQQRIYLRRRIVAGVIVIGIPLIIIVLLLGGGGGGSKVGTKKTTTTLAPGRTTTTAPLQLVVAAASWHLPVPLSRSVVLPVNTNIGVFGGLTTGATSVGVTSKNIYEIDPVTGIGTAIATMTAPVHDAAGAVIGSDYYVFGGGAASESASVQKYTFTNSNTLTGSLAASLPSKRADLTATSFNGQVYLAGGFDGKQWLPSLLATTDGATFTALAQLATPVRYPAAAALNGKLYLIGGELAPKSADATNVQQIDLQTGAVTSLSPLPVGLSHASAAVVNNTIYVFGGRSGGHAIDTISVLNPATGQLQSVGQLPAARSDMGVTVVGSTAYLLGGETDTGKQVNTAVTVRLVAPGGG